jgi:4-alpha-glucanotransferase
MKSLRTSGILLHPTSLPGRFGIGDLGREAYRFVDFLSEAGQGIWQVLPLGPTAYGDSPYQCFSALAGNPLLISPERLVEWGLLSDADLEHHPHFPASHVDFGAVIDWKRALLRRVYERFHQSPGDELHEQFASFRHLNAAWLGDYALFRALKEEHGGAAWNAWEEDVRRRDPRALADARKRLHDTILTEKLAQFLFFKQWHELKEHCNARGIKLMGDVPIFVAYDSTDVWAHPELFCLDALGNPTVVAGVPPDYFSKTGQLWGNPLYDWERMGATGYAWWIERIRAVLRLVDVVRLDHFRGFAAYWEVPSGEATAENGRWVHAPGSELFTALKAALGSLPIIAEDLGLITPDVEALRDHFDFPGMRVLQFAFGGDATNGYLPHNYVPNSVVYTGTHDNDTTVGWFQALREGGAKTKRERTFCLKYLDSDGTDIHWDVIRAALASVSDRAIVPLQDLLGLDSSARMNVPSSAGGNWSWRLRGNALTHKLSRRLRDLTELYGRVRPPEPVVEVTESPAV